MSRFLILAIPVMSSLSVKAANLSLNSLEVINPDKKFGFNGLEVSPVDSSVLITRWGSFYVDYDSSYLSVDPRRKIPGFHKLFPFGSHAKFSGDGSYLYNSSYENPYGWDVSEKGRHGLFRISIDPKLTRKEFFKTYYYPSLQIPNSTKVIQDNYRTYRVIDLKTFKVVGEFERVEQDSLWFNSAGTEIIQVAKKYLRTEIRYIDVATLKTTSVVDSPHVLISAFEVDAKYYISEDLYAKTSIWNSDATLRCEITPYADRFNLSLIALKGKFLVRKVPIADSWTEEELIVWDTDTCKEIARTIIPVVNTYRTIDAVTVTSNGIAILYKYYPTLFFWSWNKNKLDRFPLEHHDFYDYEGEFSDSTNEFIWVTGSKSPGQTEKSRLKVFRYQLTE